MEWVFSWYLTIGLLWLLASAACIALVAINPPDREDELLAAMLRDGLDPEADDLADERLAPTTIGPA
ncbi:MAG TPA: hypothetical protein VM491_00450 [Burkholderiaceae bacterium]|jgi:hypothetical protein|nr:hypothetical protein [Burkholderiaceae bacterium]